MIRIKNNLTPSLPNEYQEVEYIESTGTQYIDTGVNADYKLSLKFNAQVTDISSTTNMGATYHLSDNNYIRHYFNTQNNGLRYWYDGNYYVGLIETSSASILKKKYDYTIDIYNNQLSSSYGKSFTISRKNFDCQISYWLFKRNSNNVALQTNMKMKLYSCQMYYEDTLIRNFIPCYRKLDNEVGLYDLVNNQFYTNAGTGVFLMGTEVNKADVNLMPMIGNKKVLKRYIGENLVYHKNRDTFFTSCPFPTSWTEVTVGTKYKATNEYGEWKIWADNFFGASATYLYLAFDRDNSTSWQSSEHSDSTTSFEIGIDLPINCLINPSSIYIKSMCASGTSSSYYAKVMGYNPSTESWEKLGEFIGATSVTEENLVVSQAIFYSKFKLVMYRYSFKKKYNLVHEFQITSGTLRKES